MDGLLMSVPPAGSLMYSVGEDFGLDLDKLYSCPNSALNLELKSQEEKHL